MEQKKHISRCRHWVQAAWFALTNGYAAGYLQGRIYTGKSKALCVPGLNCYSCPGALYACPIGSLQAVLDSGSFKVSCYVFGLLMAFGTLLGRFVCGWLCPFGFVQDLLHKIPLKHKQKNMPGDRWLRKLKYIVLLVFVIILPYFARDGLAGVPWFCKWICPSGTLLGGIPLVLVNEGIRSAAVLFRWKTWLLFVILWLSVKYSRPFCKYVCPLGALYGVFNPISFYRLKVDRGACVQCGACQSTCPMDVKTWQTPNSAECIRCGRCVAACPQGALTTTVRLPGAKAPAGSAATDENAPAEHARHAPLPRGWKPALRWGLLAAAAVLIVLGVKQGEVAAVLNKAINICLECIGIG